MVVVRDPCQRGQRLSLAAGAEDELLVWRQVLELGRAYERSLRHVHVPEVARDVRVLAHGPSDDADLAAESDSDVDRLLHTVDVRRERRHEDAPFT